MTLSSRDGGRSYDVGILLREGPWVRRLALDLLGDEARADDLSQDVLVTALDSAPGLEGPRLRGWLGTVTRRMAGRSRERERARRHAEHRAARPEAVEDDARAHLELHRRLAGVIESLEAPYRTALVMRYLEGLPPRTIAARLGIPATAARKRVSRGLALLRARLDEEYGGDRKAWLAALGAVAREGTGPARGGPAPAPAGAGGGFPLLSLLTSKTALAVLAAGLGLGLWLLFGSPWDGGAPAPAAGVAEAPERAPAGERGAPFPRGDAPLAGQRRSVQAPPEAGPVTRVRVVDEMGAGARSARAAWIDGAGAVRALELDESSSAPLPEGSGDARFFASAPGYGMALATASAPAEEVVIELRAAREVRGRVIEDGAVPAQRVRLRWFSSDRDLGLRSGEREALEQLGVLRRLADTRTRPDGSFALSGLRRGQTGTLVLPSTHRLIAVDGVAASGDRDRLTIRADDGGLRTLETARLPSISGRLVWENDGAPYSGEIWIVLRELQGGNDRMSFEQSAADGRFEIGLPVSERALLGPLAQRAGSLLCGVVRFGVMSAESSSFERRVELAGATLPLDLGSVLVPRARVASLRILAAGGEPVAGAAVASSVSSSTSGPDGSVLLPFAEGDVLQVLAPGHALASVDVRRLSEAPLEVTLAPGTTLAVRPSVSADVRGGADVAIELAWSETPFEGARLEGEGPREPYPAGVQRAFHRRAIIGAGWSNEKAGAPGHLTLSLPADGVLVVPGLVAGAALRVLLVDALHQTLAERSVDLPPSGGLREVELALEPGRHAALRLRLVDAAGESIPGGSVLVRGGAGFGKSFDCRDGLLELGPLAPGVYDLSARARGRLPLRISGHELTAGAPPLELELEAARTLAVATTDSLGRALAPRSIRLRAEGGWSAEEREPSIGRTVFPAVPARPLELELTLGTRTWTRAVEPGTGEVEIVLPAHGRLAIQVDPVPELRGEDGEVVARVRELGSGDVARLGCGFSDDASGLPELQTDLLPGLYLLEIDLVEGMGEELEQRRPLARREVEIEEGALTRIVVGS